MKFTGALLVVLSSAGCADVAMSVGQESDTGDPLVVASQFLLSVEPAPGNPDLPDLLPRLFGPFAAGEGFDLEMEAPVRVRGTVRGERVSPWLAGLPSTQVAVEGTVTLFDSDGQVAASARTDSAGFYSLDVVPGTYVLGVTPEDGRIAARTDFIAVDGPLLQDLLIDAGAPLWGRVLTGTGDPLAGVPVRAINKDGLASATVLTDVNGWYELRVEPNDSWTVVTSGRVDGRDPTLRSAEVKVDQGQRVDLTYGYVGRATVRLRVTDAVGQPVDGVRVRATSRSLEGFDPGTASFQLDFSTDSRGDAQTDLPDGAYRIEVLPEEDDPWSGWSFDVDAMIGAADLGTVALAPFAVISGSVIDAAGAGLQGAAVRISERTSRPRTWHAATDAGQFTIDVPDAEMDIFVLPPGDRTDLAARRVVAVPGELTTAVQLTEGEAITGRVTLRRREGAVPVSFTVVRVLGTDLLPWAYAVTDADGNFEARIDRSELAVDTGLVP